MPEDARQESAVWRGGVLECGDCRAEAIWNPTKAEYKCPNCGVVLT